jgi:hypothetical protein
MCAGTSLARAGTVRWTLLALVAACSSPTAPPPGGDPGVDAAGAEQQPEPAPGKGVADPASSTLHDHGCAGVDWQLIGDWLLTARAAPMLAPPDELDRCVARYAGWVTNDADAANVSRGMVYAALAATGQCAADHDYDGALVSGAQCAAANSGMDAAACLVQMQASRAFGIATLVQVLDGAGQDPPLVAAKVATGKAECGGTDRWKLVAPDGFVDHFVGAYNAYHARSAMPPACKKHIVVTAALYTGMGKPGEGGVAEANGCWTYERVTKSDTEWKLCQYNGNVFHPDGVKWAYDDTNTYNDLTTETNRVAACSNGTPIGGYIYMANRGSGWRKVTTTHVRSHFAELYSSQTEVDDQFSLWKNGGEPGAPMVNFGEAATTASMIATSTARTCAEVADKDWWGVYVYPTSLDDARMTAMVKALNDCTM